MKKSIQKNFTIAAVGFLASLAMFLVLYVTINVVKIAPFNIFPSSAFLYNLGIEGRGYGLLLHFCYGVLWSYVFVYTFEEDSSKRKAIILSILLWGFMMIVYSPIIGWGIFGMGYASYLPADHPLYLVNSFSYIFFTLIVHLVYGFSLGYLTNVVSTVSLRVKT